MALLLALPICGLALYFGWHFFRDQVAPPPAVAPAVLKPRPQPVEKAAIVAPRKASPPGGRGPEVVLILDDVGFDNQPLSSAMRIDGNINFSVLPNARNAHSVAEVLHRNGFEVMCHLPMEPVDYPKHSPGANAVMTSMSDDEIARTTREDIAAVPHAAGVNNHMGSAATADPRVMRSVLGALPKGMFFIDSMTTGSSVAGRLARQMSIPTAERKVFLDDVQSEPEVRRQLARLGAEAKQRGFAVGIGHMYPVTVKVLTEDIPAMRASGFRFVRASEVVD